MRSIRRRGIVLITAAFLIPLSAGCDNSTQPAEDDNPKNQVIGRYYLDTVDGDSLPLSFGPVTGENMEIRFGRVQFVDTIAFEWRLRIYHDPPASTSDEERARFEVMRRGEWSLSQGQDETMITLFFDDPTVDTASFVVPSGPLDRRAILTVHSFGVPWVYREPFPPD